MESAVFSPGGDRVFTASDHGTARLWDDATGKMNMALTSLPDSRAAMDSPMKLLRVGPNAWRYLYALDFKQDGQPVAKRPDIAA